MAEVTSGNVTVMILSERESVALSALMDSVQYFDAGPWGDALTELGEVADALGLTWKKWGA